MTNIVDKHSEVDYLFLANNFRAGYESNDSYAILFPVKSKILNSGEYGLIYLSNDLHPKLIYNEHKDYLSTKLVEIFSAMPGNFFSQEKGSLEAANIFRSFGIESVAVYFTGDESILFELFQGNAYFSLELFNDGDIVYLRRNGRDEPYAYDIHQDDLYDTIKSIYDNIV